MDHNGRPPPTSADLNWKIVEIGYEFTRTTYKNRDAGRSTGRISARAQRED